jgi:hypothetical protein
MLLATLTGCPEPLLIGNARLDANTDAAFDADGAGSVDAALIDVGLDAGASQGASDASSAATDAQQLDAGISPLVAAAQALFDTGAWLGQDFIGAALTGSAPINVQLFFVPAGGEARGMFLGACQGGCPFQQLRDAGVPGPRGTPIAFAGEFTLYYVNGDGLVLGALYTEDGFVRDLQFQWSGGGGAQPIESIFIEGPLGPITFVPLSSGRN